MSARKRGSESSLELLLDTICNTFGGILFVAILIIIMLRMTSNSNADGQTPDVSEREQMELEQQQAELQGTRDMLVRAGEGLETSIPADDSEMSELLQDVTLKQKERQQLLQNRLAALDRVATHQLQINVATRELNNLDERARNAAAKRGELEAKLKDEIRARSEKVEYSQLRASQKDEIGVILRYGRFYLWHRYNESGNRMGLNTDEFVILEESASRILATPMPHAGTEIADSPAAIAQLKARLVRFNPRHQCIAVMIWPDSYAHFRTFKQALVQLGFEYRLMPAETGKKFYDRGGTSDGVQ